MSDVLSQAEIDALLKGAIADNDINDLNLTKSSVALPQNNEAFSDEELKKLSEVADMSLGATNSVIQMMINKDVEIELKNIQTIKSGDLTAQLKTNDIALACVKYKEGFKGNSYLALAKSTGAMISDLMVGGSGDNAELTEMHISALSELMNQMMGRMTTSLSEIFKRKIDISTPEVSVHTLNSGEVPTEDFASETEYICIEFSLNISEKGNHKLLFLLPLSFAKNMVSDLLEPDKGKAKKAPPPPPPNSAFGLPESIMPPPNIQPPIPGVPNIGYQTPYPDMNMPNQAGMVPPMNNSNNNVYPPQQSQPMPSGIPPMPGMINLPGMQMPQMSPAEFGMLQMPNGLGLQSNIDLLLDVPLQITVELGRTKMLIKDVLELGIGSVVELNKLAGETVEVFVNNKLIAKGEVVVIDESFAVRITNIINPQDRVQSI